MPASGKTEVVLLLVVWETLVPKTVNLQENCAVKMTEWPTSAYPYFVVMLPLGLIQPDSTTSKVTAVSQQVVTVNQQEKNVVEMA